MNVLVACEESQRVCTAFRNAGINAFSCDIINPSGGHPEWHIKGDVTKLLNGNCMFITMDFKTHHIPGRWDMIIAFPPCTHLAVSGARHFEKKRQDGRQLKAIEFFATILNADCEHICVENPVNIIGSDYIKKHFPMYADLPNCTQYIQPYEFGSPSRKKTCLWLKGLDKLQPTKLVEPELVTYTCKDGHKTTFSKDYNTNATNRSKTYPGVAEAMAKQWGLGICE
jgi:site-specific DNA-cytosine methylase